MGGMLQRATTLAFRLAPAFQPPRDIDALAEKVTRIDHVDVRVDGAADVRMDVFRPRAEGPHPMLLWVHGGGFVVGRRFLARHLGTALAARGFVFATTDYSLAFDERYPAPLRQVTAALRTLVDDPGRFGLDPSSVALGGDSAGAQIAAQTACLHTNPGLADALGIDPAVDAADLRAFVGYCGLFSLNRFPMALRPGLDPLVRLYLGRTPAPQAKALGDVGRQATAAFPATFLTVGDGDPLRPLTRRFAAELTAAGVDVETHLPRRMPPLVHEYPLYMRSAAAVECLARTHAFKIGRAHV